MANRVEGKNPTMMSRAACFALPIMFALLTSCMRDSCDQSWLWRWDREDDLRICAEEGHRRSQLYYGKLLALSGETMASEIWLAKAIAGREAKGALEVAGAFAGYDGDRRLAERWYLRAYELGEWDAAVRLGMLREGDGDQVGANRWFERAVDKGGSYAAGSIASGLSRKPKNAALSTAWYKRAAGLGDLRGMTGYADRLAEGKGVAKNVSESLRWRRKAATHRDADGYDVFALAIALDQGIGMPRDARGALTVLRKARSRWIDDSDSETPRRINQMEERLVAELSKTPV